MRTEVLGVWRLIEDSHFVSLQGILKSNTYLHLTSLQRLHIDQMRFALMSWPFDGFYVICYFHCNAISLGKCPKLEWPTVWRHMIDDISVRVTWGGNAVLTIQSSINSWRHCENGSGQNPRVPADFWASCDGSRLRLRRFIYGLYYGPTGRRPTESHEWFRQVDLLQKQCTHC